MDKEKFDVYQMITDRVIAALERGTVPWRMPWQKLSAVRNMRGTGYQGMNVFLLGMTADLAGYACNTWGTFNQIREAGGMVRKGEHGTPVVFWKFLKIKSGQDGTPAADGEETLEKVIPFLRYYTVFNLEQQAGIPIPVIPEIQHEPIREAQAIIDAWEDKPPIRFARGRAFYSPTTDTISVPPLEHYQHTEEYYSTLFHECVHSTGHEKRLARKADGWAGFGSEDYSKEELVAEMGAAFLCAETGIVNATIENSAAYIASWLGKLKNDRRLVVTAAGAAQKAAQIQHGKDRGNAENRTDSSIAESPRGKPRA